MDEVKPPDAILCAECGRAPEGDASLEAEGWRHLPTGVEDPHPFCPECAEREFGPPA